MSEPIKYFKSFNGIRFIAFLLVFFQHTLGRLKDFVHNEFILSIIKPIIYAGGYGVTLFFVLSGFLITYILLREEHFTDTIKLKNFYLKRILRIWPLFYLLFFLSFFLYPFVMSISGNSYLPCQSPWLNAFFLNNFDNIRMASGIDKTICESYNPHISVTWSIGIEEQFYLLWPLIFIIIKKPIFRLVILLILLTLSTLFIYLNLGNETLIYFHTISSSTFLIIGGLGALLIFYIPKSIDVFANLNPLVIYLVYLLIFVFLFYPNLLPFSFSIYTKIVISILFLFIIFTQAFNQKIITFEKYKNISYLGIISYGLYLLHEWPLKIMRDILDKLGFSYDSISMTLLLSFLTIVFTGLLAHLSYKYYESFFLNLKNKFST